MVAIDIIDIINNMGKKIAYTMNGLVGGLSGKNSSYLDLDSRHLILNYTFNSIKKYIASYEDIDFYVFSWNPELKDEFYKHFNFKDSKFTDQIHFKIPGHLPDNNRSQAHYSRWYGVQQVNDMINNSNIKYDIIINARMDMVWNEPIDFNTFDTSKIQCARYIKHKEFGMNMFPLNKNSNFMCDHVISMNQTYFNEFATLFNNLNEFSKPENHRCPYTHISNHVLVTQQLHKMGVSDILDPIFINDHDAGKGTGTYDIFRYRKLTKKDLQNELQRD